MLALTQARVCTVCACVWAHAAFNVTGAHWGVKPQSDAGAVPGVILLEGRGPSRAEVQCFMTSGRGERDWWKEDDMMCLIRGRMKERERGPAPSSSAHDVILPQSSSVLFLAVGKVWEEKHFGVGGRKVDGVLLPPQNPITV